jgi:homoserine dehydrogenase
LPVSRITTRYHVTLSVADQPGALAAVANEFSRHGVSVELVEQGVLGTEAVQESGEATATLVIGTHVALESDLAATVSALSQLDAVRSVVSVLRIEGA